MKASSTNISAFAPSFGVTAAMRSGHGQVTEKRQATHINLNVRHHFEAWIPGLLWNLEPGIWSF